MANYPKWNVQKRHEWLTTPLKKKRIKRRSAKRIGLLDKLDRIGHRAAKAGVDKADTESAGEGGS